MFFFVTLDADLLNKPAALSLQDIQKIYDLAFRMGQ